MKLEHQDLLKEFYDSIAPSFPGLTQQDLNKIVCGPFNHLKKMMEADEINYMRMKYFGSFVVYPRKAKSELSYLESRVEKGMISREQADKFKISLTKHIENEKTT